MKHPSGAAEDKRQENPPEYYHSVCGDSDGLCRKRFLTIDSPQHSFAKQMKGEPDQFTLSLPQISLSYVTTVASNFDSNHSLMVDKNPM